MESASLRFLHEIKQVDACTYTGRGDVAVCGVPNGLEVLVIQLDHDAINTAVVNEQIGTAAKYANRYALISAPGGEFNKRRLGSRTCQDVCSATDAKPGARADLGIKRDLNVKITEQ